MKSYSFAAYISKKTKKAFWKSSLGTLCVFGTFYLRTSNYIFLLLIIPIILIQLLLDSWNRHRCTVNEDGIAEHMGLKTIRSIKKDALSAVGAITNKDGSVLFFATATPLKRIGKFLDQHEYMAVNLIGKQEFDQQCQTAEGRTGVALVVYILHFAKKYPTGMITLPCSRTDVENIKPLCTQFWDIIL